jgi:hypothetical protein
MRCAGGQPTSIGEGVRHANKVLAGIGLPILLLVGYVLTKKKAKK